MSEEKDLSIGSKEVESANKASASKISKSLVPHSTHIFKVQLAGSLNEATRDSIWSMFEANMRTMYKGSSFGWDPPKKQEELFNRHSRFILVYPTNDTESLVAFTAFRFEFEDEDDDSNILYCYDLQVSKTSQRHGLGRALMNHLAKIGADFGMDKIMLTVFKANKRALRFYNDFGFEMDLASPDDEDEEDYKLLSKSL
ncbi:N-acetyltransferase domain-containing protein [Mycena venus]|uniref:N-alpha-acetyltransferase 40 n=1 Tax=Mycena venus TaxID=2733690 RepID=A0A8H7CUD7_9AGAR|nr:N-acetyltransferase domain-containing protein [Mycena venus]